MYAFTRLLESTLLELKAVHKSRELLFWLFKATFQYHSMKLAVLDKKATIDQTLEKK
jgi:hypothetical protein